jgi:hypothetical protein
VTSPEVVTVGPVGPCPTLASRGPRLTRQLKCGPSSLAGERHRDIVRAALSHLSLKVVGG